MPYLIARTPDNRELSRHAITASTILGRAAECDVPLHDPHLSRLHCRLDPNDDGTWTLVDLNSRNGTLLHDKKIDQHQLNDSDTFEIAGLHITFHTGAMPPQRPKDPLSVGSSSPPAAMASSDETLSDTHTSVTRAAPTTPANRPAPLAFQRPPAAPRVLNPPPPKPRRGFSRYLLPVTVLLLGVAATVALYWYLFH